MDRKNNELENSESPYQKALPITVLLQPEEKIIEIPRKNAKTVRRLLEFLNIKLCTALVVRNNTLLTPDLTLYAGDSLLVRKVQSTG